MNPNSRITNFNYLDMVSDGDSSFKKDIIETFIKNTPGHLHEMKEALKNNNWKKIGDIAHSLKPSFTLLGMENRKEIVLNIEEFGKNKINTELIPGLIKDLERLIDQVIIELNDDLKKI